MSGASVCPRPLNAYRNSRGIPSGPTRTGASRSRPSSKRASGATWAATRPAYVYGSAFATSAKAARPSPAISSAGSKRPSRPPTSRVAASTYARSPGRRPSSRRPSRSTRRTSSASSPIPAEKANRRPLARPSEVPRPLGQNRRHAARPRELRLHRPDALLRHLAGERVHDQRELHNLREHATAGPRRLRDARSGQDRELLRAGLRRSDREDRGAPGHGVRRQHSVRLPRDRRRRRPRRRPRHGRGARGAEAPPRRGRDRVGGARPQDCEGRLLPRSRRAAAGGDHVRGRRRPPPSVRESAVVIEVAAAAPAVDAWRRRFTYDGPLGVPAHVTLLYPFVPPERLDDEIEAKLGAIIRRAEPFEFVLGRTERFPELLYLAPERREPFLHLTEAIAGAWPEPPPYEGVHDFVIPHLTVAGAEERVLDEIAKALEPELPIEARASEALLLEEGEDGFWRKRRRL